MLAYTIFIINTILIFPKFCKLLYISNESLMKFTITKFNNSKRFSLSLNALLFDYFALLMKVWKINDIIKHLSFLWNLGKWWGASILIWRDRPQHVHCLLMEIWNKLVEKSLLKTTQIFLFDKPVNFLLVDKVITGWTSYTHPIGNTANWILKRPKITPRPKLKVTLCRPTMCKLNILNIQHVQKKNTSRISQTLFIQCGLLFSSKNINRFTTKTVN